MSRLQSLISDAIETAASDANCCGCYCDRAAQGVLAVLIREGRFSDDDSAAILAKDKAAKAERKKEAKERAERDRQREANVENGLNRMDPTGARFTLRKMGWEMSSISVSPNGITRLEMWGPTGKATMETPIPEQAFPTFLAEVIKAGVAK